MLWAGTAHGDLEERAFVVNAFAISAGPGSAGGSRAVTSLPSHAVMRVGLHAGAVTDLVASADRCFLFSASEDGCVLMMAVQEEIEDTEHRRGGAWLGVGRSMCEWIWLACSCGATGDASDGQRGGVSGCARRCGGSGG